MSVLFWDQVGMAIIIVIPAWPRQLRLANVLLPYFRVYDKIWHNLEEQCDIRYGGGPGHCVGMRVDSSNGDGYYGFRPLSTKTAQNPMELCNDIECRVECYGRRQNNKPIDRGRAK
jgi:hypothetical protein